MDNLKLIEELRKNAEALEEYTSIANDKLGDACFGLTLVTDGTAFYSDDFLLALNKEIKDHLDNYQKHSRIVREEETVTRTVEYLEWYDEEE